MNIRWTILLFLLFCSIVLSNAQDIHKTFYENGNVKEQGQFDNNGLRDGIWEAYYENGILWGVGKFHKGKQTGKWKYYHKNAMLRSIGKYDNDKEIGLWKFYHENGILKEIGRTKNGEQIGKWKYYDEKGNLINIMKY